MENIGHNNIIPPKHGEIRNPNGRPKGTRNRATIVREMLELAALERYKKNTKKILGNNLSNEMTVADQITAAIVAKAQAGDVSAFNALMDSGYGKLTDKIDNTHSFNKMDDVKVAVKSDNAPAVELSFDIGGQALHEAKEED